MKKTFGALKFSHKLDDGSSVTTNILIDDRADSWLAKKSVSLAAVDGEIKVKVNGVNHTPLLVLNVSERFNVEECRAIALLLLKSLNALPENATLDEVTDAFKEAV